MVLSMLPFYCKLNWLYRRGPYYRSADGRIMDSISQERACFFIVNPTTGDLQNER